MSVIEAAQALISKRIEEIDAERVKLEKALSELGGKAKRKPGPKPGRRKGASNGAAPKQRRKRAGGSRLDQAVEMVKAEPGIGVSKIAKTMSINPNYLYRVLGEAEKEKLVRKEGRQYYPVTS